MSLHYKVRGQGPALVLVSGLGGIAEFWDPVSDLLSTRFTVVTFDHPGVGRSAARGRSSIEGIVSAVLEIVDGLGIQRFGVIGHSTGGLVAQALALDWPGRMAGVILSCTWAQPDARFRGLFGLRKAVLTNVGMGAYGVLGSILAYPPDYYAQHCAAALPVSGKDDDPRLVAIQLDRIDMLLDYSRVDELSQIDAPVMVVGATDDWIVPYQHSQQLVSAIPGARITGMTGGHFLPRTQAVRYAEVVLGFLSGVSDARWC